MALKWGPIVRTLILLFALSALWVGPAFACTSVGKVSVGDECDPEQVEDEPSDPPDSRSASERQLLASINHDREAEGLRSLAADDRAREVARDHAERMAKKGKVYHNDWLGTADGKRALGWPTWLGENVGMGPNAERVHTAFMTSDGHREQILTSGYRRVGIGVYVKDDNIWVSQVFLTRGGATASSGSSHRIFTGGDESSDRLAPARRRSSTLAPQVDPTSQAFPGWDLPGAGAPATLDPRSTTFKGPAWLPAGLAIGSIVVPGLVHLTGRSVRRRQQRRLFGTG